MHRTLPQPDDLLEWIVAGLREEARALDEEQSPRGLDALDEGAIQALLERTLLARGLGVLREHPYPGLPGSRPKGAARERCDLVLTGSACESVRDPVAELKERDARSMTLFAQVSDEAPLNAILPADALWIELKVLGQHEFRRGVPGPNSQYASVLTRSVREDLGKLAKDASLMHAALLLVVFSESRQVAHHDVTVALHRALDKGVEFRAPLGGGFPISDRIGNAWCSAWLIGAVSSGSARAS